MVEAATVSTSNVPLKVEDENLERIVELLEDHCFLFNNLIGVIKYAAAGGIILTIVYFILRIMKVF